MAKQITKTVYTFRELLAKHEAGEVTGKAIERVRDWLREGQTDHDWWDYTYDLWTQALDQIGFENAEISFSGFWSQGDGASFTANVDMGKLIDFLTADIEPSETIAGEPEDFRPYIVQKCNGVRTNPKFRRLKYLDLSAGVGRTSHHYSHEGTCRFQAGDLHDRGELVSTSPWEWKSKTPRVRALFEEFEAAAEELRRDLSRAIYKALEDEYEYLTSDEALLDFADGNEYTFTDDGVREG